MIKSSKNILVILIFSFFTFNQALALELKLPKNLPKLGGSGGLNLKDTKTNFTTIFFESALDYMEAQYHLFNALEMNDEAGKTRKSIEFVKNSYEYLYQS